MATTSTKANIEDRSYRKRLGRQEQRIVNVAEDYTPASSSNWSTVPTTQDGALDTLAAENSGAVTRSAKATWDFATDGGTVGTIDLSDATIPDNAIIIEVYASVVTAPTSAGNTGTIKLVLPTDGDISVDITADGAGTATYGDPSGAPLSTEKKTTAARSLSVTIGTENITAGSIEYYVRYVISS